METEVIKYMTDNQMLMQGDRVGVAVSGGEDSMALLSFLKNLSNEISIMILAIHVNHNIRPTAKKDLKFVKDYCKENHIEFVSYNVNAPVYSKEHKMGIEQAARELRYQSFNTAIKKYKLTKLAIAHHLNDQAETILMHLFRGCGLEGASGMMPITDGIFIRPLLNTKKADIIAYNYHNGVPHVEDETNDENKYSRNYLRNVIMPEITKEWRNASENIVNFAKLVARDNEYISSHIDMDGIIREGNVCRIPLNRFAFDESVCSRLVYHCFGLLNIRFNMEAKHINAIIQLSRDGLNGEKVDLPNNSYAVKEYEYITLVKKEKKANEKIYSFKVGKTVVDGYGLITVTKTISHKLALQRGLFVIDADKLPKKTVWRFKRDGDMFTKFGGGTKKLNSFLTDKKVPARLRHTLPVLALGKEIFVVGGVEISENVKTDRDTIDAYVIEFTKS